MPLSWPNEAIAAASITFDGATLRQLDAANILAELGLRGTFYAYPPNLLDEPRGWRQAAEAGHELANHALFGAVDDDGLIARISREAVEDEVDEARALLAEEFGCPLHSATLPLVRTFVGDSGIPTVPQIVRRSIVRINEDQLGAVLRERYETVRTPLDDFNGVSLDLKNLCCHSVDALDAVSICLIAQVGISKGEWTILSFGPECDLETVRQVASWMSRQPVFCAPVVQVASHLASKKEPAPRV